MDNAHFKLSSTNNRGHDENQYTGGEECPISRNASLLQELDVAEEKVAELLEVAAGTLDELAAIESIDDAKVELLTKRFLELVSSVHGCLSSKANLVRDYTPYPRSIYGPRKELELLHEKADFLRSELACMAAETPGVASVSLAATISENLESDVDVPQDVGVISGLSSTTGVGPSVAGIGLKQHFACSDGI